MKIPFNLLRTFLPVVMTTMVFLGLALHHTAITPRKPNFIVVFRDILIAKSNFRKNSASLRL